MYRDFYIGGRRYQIDEAGNIPKIRGSGFIIPSESHDGYLRFTTKVGRRTINRPIHQLVYEAWVGPVVDT